MQFFKDLKAAHHAISIKTDRHYFFRILPLLWLERITFFAFVATGALSLIGILFFAEIESPDFKTNLIHLGIKFAILLAINFPFYAYSEPKDYSGGGIFVLSFFILIAFFTRLGIEQKFGLDKVLFSIEDVPDVFAVSSPVMTIVALLWLATNIILCCISVRHYRHAQAATDRLPWEF